MSLRLYVETRLELRNCGCKRNVNYVQEMDQTGATNLVKFTAENWATWKFQTKIILKSEGLLEVAKGQRQVTHILQSWIYVVT